MSSKSLIPVILSGGSGTRLWPLSRKLYPKQFIPLRNNTSLFQSTVERVLNLSNVDNILVICNDEHRFMAAEQLRQSGINQSEIILEPVGRSTAPAITIAAIHALSKNPDAHLLIIPADQIISDNDEFQLAIDTALKAVDSMLITFGVVPTRAETGFGYVKLNKTEKLDNQNVYKVEKFIEKPNLDTANKYFNDENYLWNSGIFLFHANAYLDEINTLQPEIFNVCQQAYTNSKKDLDFIRLDKKIFSNTPNISIDYAVMEKTSKAAVVPLECAWSDVGSWHALWESLDKDKYNNVMHGDVISLDCNGSYIHANNRLVTAVGVKDQIIIETSDAVLVAPRERAQEVKDIVNKLKENERDETDIHPKVYRPWGAYETIDIEDRFQVKRITVNPGQILSLQMHHHRAEHWIVVKGTAKVTRGEEQFLLSENESTYIPIGTKHRLENPGMIPLELIEVQSGTYLGEDDITRFEDLYGR